MLGKIEGKEGDGRLLDSITDSMNTNLSKLWEIDMKVKEAWQATVFGITKSWM